MRYKIFFILLSSVMLLAFTKADKNYQTECVSVETDGAIIIKIWNSKSGAKYSQMQAQKDAISAILFSGIQSGGCITQPPMLSTQEAIKNFEKIEKDFFSKSGAWSTYTHNASIETAIPSNIGDNKWKVYRVSVSKTLLRKYLEEQNIIKPLNSGF